MTASIVTIGYGGRTWSEFAELIRHHKVEFLIDVRSAPYSRFQPEFSQSALKLGLREVGVSYLHMGDELGGRPADPSCYTAQGLVDYEECRKRPEYQHGIDRVLSACEQGKKLALMCSEGKPENCHRFKLVAMDLVGRGVRVGHIDENGNLLEQDDVERRLTGGQVSLFGDQPAAPLVRSRAVHKKPA